MNYKSYKNYRLGMRNVKTAIAVLICLLLGELLNMDSPFYVVIAAMISMESSVMNSFDVGKNRVMGTVLGALLGMGFAYIDPGNLILTSIGITIIIYICNLFKWNKSIVIAGVVFLSIMLEMAEGSILANSLNRIADTILGLGVGLAVNYLIFPYDFEKTIKTQADALVEIIKQDVNDAFCTNEKVDLEKFREALNSLSDEINDYRAEFAMKKKNARSLAEKRKLLERFDSIYTHLKVMDKISKRPVLSDENLQQLEDLHFEGADTYQHESKAFKNVYNYHAEALLEKMKELGIDGACDK
ncbi:FUSC family protein [Alkalibacter saccharofermentans]|uniref:Uncharacterized membrane protein YgaE, UPF0421/DUF939 family n=1 Tax=Alkalibacter saccharofermentans DSM 14828 TaxID=1120975 RepID=A0A1M4WMA7_9FIRM|nr:aromatic acid exporter family protein [Alkalibacter saccharofermentans]SHE82389.1 Uncharacterized membrane protein YgaE, UPF0421/DUF939 family [Alkalibacter saccharofermentans DSM 14828]